MSLDQVGACHAGLGRSSEAQQWLDHQGLPFWRGGKNFLSTEAITT